jgi:hypothetical protein
MKTEVYISKNGGVKTMRNYPNGFTVQVVKGYPYTNGKVDIHITKDGSSSTGGANWDDSISLTENQISILNQMGGRITTKHILYGKQMVDEKTALAKTRDMMVLAELLSSAA